MLAKVDGKPFNLRLLCTKTTVDFFKKASDFGIHARKTKASTCWQGKKYLKSMAHKDIFHLLNVKKALCKVSLRDNIDILWL